MSMGRSLLGTDISKITRKPSRTGKPGHENRKSTNESKDAKPKPEKVNLQSKLVKQWSTKDVAMEESTVELGFTLDYQRGKGKKQGSHQGLPPLGNHVRHAFHTQLFDQEVESFSSQSFYEDVCELIFGSDKVEFHYSILHMLLNKVEVIKNGNKVLRRTVGTVEHVYEPTTTEEKQDKRNEMKARATLLMALPNKDQLKFHSYQDAKLLMEAIKKRYGGNKESKKVQRTLLKQQYENFAALSSESMDQTFDRLQKLISQLEIQGEVINQEDMNLKLLRSFPSEWKTHALIWRNKVEIETISLDDLYNNLKIYEQEITDNLCDPVICAFLEMAMLTIRARRFIKRTGKKLDINGQRVSFDKSKVECFNCHKHGHFARECRFPRNQEYKGRENNTRTIAVETPTQNALIAQDGIGGYDWSYQAEEEQPTNHALMAFTSSGSSSSSDSEVDSCSKTCVKAYATLKEQYDNLSSDYKKSQFNLVSYKAGLESVEARLAHYKKNEAVFEESINVLKLEVRLRDNALNEYKMNMEKVEKERDELKQTLEKFQNSSKSLNNILESQIIDKFKTGLGYDAATAASSVVESFVNLTDKSGSDNGYHSVPPPLTGNFIPRKPDLTFVDEIVKSENLDVTTVVSPSNAKTVENKGVSNTVESNVVRMNNTSAPIIKDWNFDNESEIDYTVRPNTEKIESVKTVRETDAPKQNKQYPRGNQRNWNNLMSQRLGSDFKMTNKACYVCGSFEHLHYVCDKKVERPMWNNSRRVNHKNFTNKMTHPHPKRSFVPQAVLTRSGKLSTAGVAVNTVRPVNTANTKAVNTVRPVNTANTKAVNTVRSVNTAASKPIMNHPRTKTNAFKRGYSQSSRPFNRHFANKNSIINTNVNTARVKHTTARDRAVVSENKGKGANVVKASACWVWKAKNSSAQLIQVIFYIEHRADQHMTGNKCYLDEYEDYDGGFISFGDGKGRISGKDTMNLFVDYLMIDSLKPLGYPVTILNTKDHLVSMNYVPVDAGNKSNGIAGTKDNIDSKGDTRMMPTEVNENEVSDISGKHDQEARIVSESTPVSTVGPSFDTVVPSTPVNAVGPSVSTANESEEQLFERSSPFKNAFTLPPVPKYDFNDNTASLGNAYDDGRFGEEVDMNNVISSYSFPDTSFTKFHKDHPEDQAIGSLKTPV
ncbi:ribonuclease H-like domain-containing protein [Tanacetum coccineum]|uniref:Ribonuclease H-like domain-containing protein n=1 Tax=Tanacetum coccineum TaxID=301880 RepID=A0ABQ5B7Y7_9ASTR